jgi:LysM repeat protein
MNTITDIVPPTDIDRIIGVFGNRILARTTTGELAETTIAEIPATPEDWRRTLTGVTVRPGSVVWSIADEDGVDAETFDAEVKADTAKRWNW